MSTAQSAPFVTEEHDDTSSPRIAKADGLPARPSHQRFVFTDPVALRYLEEDPSTMVLHRRLRLQGYEIYIVEQWACSRIHPTFAITTYTGDPSHTVFVGVLSVPTDESTWSSRLKLYYSAVAEYHTRKKETPLGILMVTDLSSFPSSLMVIPVPSGDIKRHRDDFVVNENLKRLGCSGRASLKLQPPPASTEAKFHQLYRTSERVPLYDAVMELVKQCQMALMMFCSLAPEYVDGLLCDVTETAIADWWMDIGFDLYNIEPSDGVLGPTTVAALLGTLLGARNRLHAFGAPVGKDAFDIPNLKRGIGSFQKSQKLQKTRRLDRQTLGKLHRVTAKAVNSEGWTDAVKSTMAELSGQGGEMVMEMVRGRDKRGIADIETLDLDNFAHLVNGARAKWLWLGKPRKGAAGDGFGSGPPASDMMFTTDDRGGYVWTSRRRHSNDDLAGRRSLQESDSPLRHTDAPDSLDGKDQNLRRTVRKGVSGKVTDARIGFGRFKDAVGLPGLRSHQHKSTKDDVDLVADASYLPSVGSEIDTPRPKHVAEFDDQIYRDNAEYPAQDRGEYPQQLNAYLPKSSDLKPPEIVVEPVAPTPDSETRQKARQRHPQRSPSPTDDGSYLELCRTRSTEASHDREQALGGAAVALRRPRSCMDFNQEEYFQRKDNYWPHHLSFSAAEEVVLQWEGLGGQDVEEKPSAALEENAAQQDTLGSTTQLFGSRILELGQNTVPWVERQVDSVEALNQFLYERHKEINAIYDERLRSYQNVQERSDDLLTEERSFLTDNIKRVELLGAKLDYEVNVLESKVEDVESGLAEFERHVIEIETRMAAVKGGEQKQSSSWLSRLGRLAGISTQGCTI